MNLFVHFARRPMLGLLLIACGPSESTMSQPETSAENFGVREVDPWATDAEPDAQQQQGRQVYVPEPSPVRDEEPGDDSGQPGNAGNEDNPDDEGGTTGNGSSGTNDDDPPEDQTPPPPPPPPAPTGIQGRFTFSDTASLLYVQVFKDENTLGARFAHNHAIRSTGWQGSLTRAGQGIDCTVNLELPVEGLVPDEPEMRRRVGYDDEISVDQRQEIRGHMVAENQLNLDTHPTMTFQGTRCRGADAERGTVSVEGQLTIRGVAKPVIISLQYRLLEGRLYLRGELPMTHRDFGFEPYSAFAGSVRNQEGMILGFDFQSVASN
jgi:hypothetical protein